MERVETEKESLVRVGREVAERTAYPKVRRLLTAFMEACPECGSGRSGWEFDFSDGPPIREGAGYDLVAYRCACGAQFRKVEDTDE